MFARSFSYSVCGLRCDNFGRYTIALQGCVGLLAYLQVHEYGLA